MDTTLDPRWQNALAHSHYVAQLLQAHPELIPELLATWQQPLCEEMMRTPLQGPFADV